MKCSQYIAIIAALFLLTISGLASADVLPQPVPENQLFTRNTIMEGVGAVQEKNDATWQIGDAGLTSLANPRYNDAGNVESGSIAYATYSDSIMSNGGQISEVKSFSMDTQAKTTGLYNIETKKVLTYTSQSGSHLMGAESYVLDIAGDWRSGVDNVVCVFSQAKNDIIPAFCNKVTASSKLSSITTAQIETSGALTTIADRSDVPAAVQYEISVTPDINSASGYADGIVSTTFTVSVMEGRSDGTIVPIGGAQPAQAAGVYPIDGAPAGADAVPFAALINYPGYDPNNLPNIFNVDTLTIRYLPRGGGDIAHPKGDATNQDKIEIFDNDGNTMLTLEYDGTNWIDPSPAPIVDGFSNALSWISGGDGTLQTLNAAAMYQGLGLPLSNNQQTWDPRDSFVNRPATAAVAGVDPVPELQDAFGNRISDELASTMTYIDTATMTGGISNFNKVFNYQSGIACENC